MLKNLKKYLTLFLVCASLTQPVFCLAAEDKAESDMLDDSLRDFSMVLGAGAAGAILGLSTLSFVERPSAHLKNIAVGGAIGIVIGVGYVIFSQATRSTNVIATQADLGPLPLNPDRFEAQTRQDFAQFKVVQQRALPSDLNFSFTF